MGGSTADLSAAQASKYPWHNQRAVSNVAAPDVELGLEKYRAELTAYCYRMLGSPFDAEDAVQDTFVRAWRGIDGFEGRAALRTWLYRIATNVCLDMLGGKERRARPMDLGPAGEPVMSNLHTLPETTWIEPVPDAVVTTEGDPVEMAASRETIRLAFIAALQHLPPRQRAALILCEVLHWKAAEAAELLDTTVASINSALQRARATLDASGLSSSDTQPAVDESQRELLERYVEAFERYDIDALTSLIHEDATQSMPPYDLWLRGRDDIFAWWLGPGITCKDSRVIPVVSANGAPAFGQYRPRPTGDGREPWALQVLEIEDGRIVDLTFFLDTERLFPLFGLPLQFTEVGRLAVP
jgi:RNA polymerase sigma-70 factor (ECF subfamily)